MRPRGQHSGGKRRVHGRVLGTLVAAAALLALPASAQANLDLTGSHAEPTNLQAGAHSDFKIHAQFGSEDVKDLTISLPPGEVGNPLATDQCDPGQLPNCPANTAVGTVSSSVTIASLAPQTINGTVFNLTPNAGEPARFGIVLNASPVPLPPPLNGLLLPPTVVQSGAALRQSDFGLDTIVHDIPHTAALIGGLPLTVPVHIKSMDLTLQGTASTGNAFMRNPTSCDPHTVRFSGDSYSSATVVSFPSPSFTPTNCGSLDFSPTLTATVGGEGQTTNGVPTTVITSIDQDLDEAGLLKAQVTVPPDFTPNPVPLGGACSQAAFQAGTCGPSAQVGTAVASSPLLSQALTGPVYLVNTDPPGPFPNVGLDLQGQLHLKLQGTLDINKTTTFDNLPDIPIAHFALAFTPSPGLLQTARDICVPPPPVFHADFTGYNGATTSMDPAATVLGCGPGSGSGAKGKCKKAKKHKKKHRAAEAKKKHKKKKCKRKKRKHKKR
jgi:hypothetical protein